MLAIADDEGWTLRFVNAEHQPSLVIRVLHGDSCFSSHTHPHTPYTGDIVFITELNIDLRVRQKSHPTSRPPLGVDRVLDVVGRARVELLDPGYCDGFCGLPQLVPDDVVVELLVARVHDQRDVVQVQATRRHVDAAQEPWATAWTRLWHAVFGTGPPAAA